jgi:hypothetical protein
MSPIEKKLSTSAALSTLFFCINALVLKLGFTRNEDWYRALFLTIPVLLLLLYASFKKRGPVPGSVGDSTKTGGGRNRLRTRPESRRFNAGQRSMI